MAAQEAGSRYNISQLMQWGKALVNSNKAHHPSPTTEGASMRRLAAGHYHNDARSSNAPSPAVLVDDASRLARPPSAPGLHQQQHRDAATTVGRRREGSMISTSTAANRAPSAGASRPATPNGGSSGGGDATMRSGNSTVGAEPPSVRQGPPRRLSETYAPPRDARGVGGGSPTPASREGQATGMETPLSVLSAALDEEAAAAAVASRSEIPIANRTGTPSVNDTSFPTTPTLAPQHAAQRPLSQRPAPPRFVASDAPQVVRSAPPSIPHLPPPAVSASELMTKLAQLEIRLRAAADDEAACGKCVASLMSVAENGAAEEAQVPDKAARCLAGLPRLASMTAELSAIAAKMATQTRDIHLGDSVNALYRTPMPTPPRALAVTSLNEPAAIAAARDAISAFCSAASGRLAEVEAISSANLQLLQQAADVATSDRAAQAAVVDAAHDTLGTLTEDMEGLQTECGDISLQIATRRRRLDDVSRESQNRQVHIAALRRTAREASTTAESLQQQAQRDSMALLQLGQDTVGIKGQSDTVSDRRAAVIAQERQLRIAETEGDVQHEQTDRQIRRAQAALDEKSHELKIAVSHRDDAAQAVAVALQAAAQAREDADGLELQLRALKRDEQMAKEALRSAEVECRAAEADLEASHRDKVLADRECRDATALLESTQRSLVSEKTKHGEAASRVALLELALHRLASRQADSAAQAGLIQVAHRPPMEEAGGLFSPPSPLESRPPERNDLRDSRATSRRASAVAEALAADAPHFVAEPTSAVVHPVDTPTDRSGSRVTSAPPVATLPTKRKTWRASADRVSDAETPATTLIGEAVDLPMSPERGPMHVAIHPRLYHSHQLARGNFNDAPRIPSLLRQSTTPGVARGYDTPVSIVSEPRPASGGQFDDPHLVQPSPSTGHRAMHAHTGRSMSRGSSVYSAPNDDDDDDEKGEGGDIGDGTLSFPPAASRRLGAPPATLLQDDTMDAAQRLPPATTNFTPVNETGSTASSGAHPMAAIEARLKSLLARRGVAA